MANSNDSVKIFISHTSADSDLAQALVLLLRAAMPLSANDIRCTSVDGYKLPPGVTTDAALRLEVNESSVLIGLLTPQSLQSSYVLFELGARWGVERFLIPLLAKGAGYESLPSPLSNTNAVRGDNRGEVNDMLDSVASELGLALEKSSSWGQQLNDFLDAGKKKRQPRIRTI